MLDYRKKIIDIYPHHHQPERELKEGRRISIRSRTRKKRPVWWFIFALVLVILFSLTFYFRKAFLEIWPEGEMVDQEKEAIFDVQALTIKNEQNILPAHYLSKETTIEKEFSSSGKEKREEKARGIIRVFNEYHLSQTLVARTRFLSPEGKLFYLLEQVYIPPGQSLDVEVEAAEPGPEYNIGPTTFSLPGLVGSPRYTFVYGKSFSPMEGGASFEVRIITEEDLNKAEETLLGEISIKLKEQILQEQSNELILLKDSLKIETLEKSASGEVSEEKERFSYRLRARIKGIAIRKSDVEEYCYHLALSQFQEQRIIKISQCEIISSSTDQETDTGKLVLKIKAKAFFVLPEALLKQSLEGKSLEEAEKILEEEPIIRAYRLKVFPFWLKNIPSNIEVKIRVDDET